MFEAYRGDLSLDPGRLLDKGPERNPCNYSCLWLWQFQVDDSFRFLPCSVSWKSNSALAPLCEARWLVVHWIGCKNFGCNAKKPRVVANVQTFEFWMAMSKQTPQLLTWFMTLVNIRCAGSWSPVTSWLEAVSSCLNITVHAFMKVARLPKLDVEPKLMILFAWWYTCACRYRCRVLIWFQFGVARL